MTVLAALLVVYPFVGSWGRYGAVIENGPGRTALVVGSARPGRRHRLRSARRSG